MSHFLFGHILLIPALSKPTIVYSPLNFIHFLLMMLEQLMMKFPYDKRRKRSQRRVRRNEKVFLVFILNFLPKTCQTFGYHLPLYMDVFFSFFHSIFSRAPLVSAICQSPKIYWHLHIYQAFGLTTHQDVNVPQQLFHDI